MAIFWVFWGTYSPKYDHDEIFTRATIQDAKNIAQRIFTETGCIQSLHFLSNFDPLFSSEDVRN